MREREKKVAALVWTGVKRMKTRIEFDGGRTHGLKVFMGAAARTRTLGGKVKKKCSLDAKFHIFGNKQLPSNLHARACKEA